MNSLYKVFQAMDEIKQRILETNSPEIVSESEYIMENFAPFFHNFLNDIYCLAKYSKSTPVHSSQFQRLDDLVSEIIKENIKPGSLILNLNQQTAVNTRNNVSKKQRFAILKKYNYTCQYCGRKSPEVKLQIDHVHPVSKGGTNAPENLTVACQECNLGKSDSV